MNVAVICANVHPFRLERQVAEGYPTDQYTNSTAQWLKVTSYSNKKAELSQRRPRDATYIWVP